MSKMGQEELDVAMHIDVQFILMKTKKLRCILLRLLMDQMSMFVTALQDDSWVCNLKSGADQPQRNWHTRVKKPPAVMNFCTQRKRRSQVEVEM